MINRLSTDFGHTQMIGGQPSGLRFAAWFDGDDLIRRLVEFDALE